jgi:hypothetical protein
MFVNDPTVSAKKTIIAVFLTVAKAKSEGEIGLDS